MLVVFVVMVVFVLVGGGGCSLGIVIVLGIVDLICCFLFLCFLVLEYMGLGGNVGF